MQLRMLSPEKLRLWKSQRIWILDMSILQSYLQKTFTRKYNFVREYKRPSNELTNVNGGFTNPLMEKRE